MAAIDCTPNTLLAAFPCAQCLSEHELKAILALLLCKIVGASADADCTVLTLAEDAKCFSCMSDHQMLEAVIAIVAQFAIDQGYLVSNGTLRQDAACLICADPKTINAILLKKFCDGVSAGSFCAR